MEAAVLFEFQLVPATSLRHNKGGMLQFGSANCSWLLMEVIIKIPMSKHKTNQHQINIYFTKNITVSA